MKKFIYTTYIGLLACVLFASCNSFNDAFDAEKVDSLTVAVTANVSVEGVSAEGLTIKFDNYTEDIHLSKTLTGTNNELSGIIPGIYNVTISGKTTDSNGDEYYLNGTLVNKPLYKGANSINITVGGLKISPLIFKEIFYAGSPKYYFRNQFYELYNNSSNTLYLDGIYFAELIPTTATTKLPVWPTSDGDNYCYGNRVWKFPGSGTDYPLKPGESCVISQFAANHKLPIYCPNSPVDCSSSEFEFNMNNKKYPDQPAVDMVHVFYNGKAEKGSTPQYLTSVFGGAYVIFQVPKGDTYDPVGNENLSTRDFGSKYATLYAKIPITYVLDAVEAGQNETMINAKRVPGVLDAGMTYVGSTYCSLGVARYPLTDDNGNYVYQDCGSMIFKDTNNSTDDFQRGVVPELRRYGTKMPSWNHTLIGK